MPSKFAKARNFGISGPRPSFNVSILSFVDVCFPQRWRRFNGLFLWACVPVYVFEDLRSRISGCSFFLLLFLWLLLSKAPRLSKSANSDKGESHLSTRLIAMKALLYAQLLSVVIFSHGLRLDRLLPYPIATIQSSSDITLLSFLSIMSSLTMSSWLGQDLSSSSLIHKLQVL